MILATLLLSGVTITLPMEAHVPGTEVRLGEFAEVAGPDAEVVQEVENLSLGYAPAPGFSRLVWNHKVAEVLRAHDPDLAFTFVGQRATRVWPLVETVTAEALAEAAEVSLVEAVGRGDFTWDLRETLRDVDVPAAGEPAQLLPKPARGALEGGVVSVPVEVRVAGETYRTLWTTWDLKAWETVPVLTRRVPAGRRVTADLLENKRVLTTPARTSKPLPASLLQGATAVRDLGPGEVVTELDVHRPPAILTGDSIFLEVRKGAIAARVPAIAREAGAIGDRIRVVRSDAPAAEMSAVIASRDLVRIDLAKEPN